MTSPIFIGRSGATLTGGIMNASQRVVSDLGVDTQVVPDGSNSGRYTATIPDWWNVLFAFGGFTSTLALRAAEAAMGRTDFVPISATATFFDPVPCGEVAIDTHVLRAGNSMAHCQSVLRAAGSEQIGVRVLAIFGKRRASELHVVDMTFPSDVPPVSQCALVVPPPGWPLSESPVLGHHELRLAVGHPAWEDGWSPGRPRLAAWARYHKPALLTDGSIDPVTYFLPSDHLMPAVNQTLGPKRQAGVLVSLEISIQFFGTTRTPWILQDSRVPHVDSG